MVVTTLLQEVFLILQMTLGANNNTIEGFVMTPNPANSFIQVQGASNSPMSLQIFDILGKQVLTLENANRVNIQSLTSGMYIVKAVQNGALQLQN